MQKVTELTKSEKTCTSKTWILHAPMKCKYQTKNKTRKDNRFCSTSSQGKKINSTWMIRCATSSSICKLEAEPETWLSNASNFWESSEKLPASDPLLIILLLVVVEAPVLSTTKREPSSCSWVCWSKLRTSSLDNTSSSRFRCSSVSPQKGFLSCKYNIRYI